jgi:hypothetical protein
MHYTVVWLPTAQNQLAELWMASANRAAITAAANEVDRLLRDDPETRGVDFYGDRLLVVPPLQIVYSVRPDDRIVEVQQAW